ncbi:hypothetical protein RvY_08111-2 [Ramazzottius varieornatus]|uniref:Uncharacterized protein n=1 Tax=Ramazzottius varieornatus TaxID=947166 RepID=A0A1D1V4M2_RAMVA|nr:hypothetical protein RvY_08111-2 [Ramazzottius varieornatus]
MMMFAGTTDHHTGGRIAPPGNGPHRHWRFPPWMVWGGLHEQQRNYRSFNPPPFIRRIPPRSHTISSDFKICDCPIVCYFSMSISLILIGCLTTFFVLDDTFDSFSHAVSQLWLVGPLFISCGIVIFVRTVIFMRRKRMMQRQRTELRRRRRLHRRSPTDGRHIDVEAACSRSRDSFSSLPPDYEAVINGVYSSFTPRHHSLSSARGRRLSHQYQRPSLAFLNLEEPPPSYDEVTRLPFTTRAPRYVDVQAALGPNGPISTIQNEVRRFSTNRITSSTVIPKSNLDRASKV